VTNDVLEAVGEKDLLDKTKDKLQEARKRLPGQE